MSSENGPTTCLYECSVMHRRLSPKVHHFNYSLFLFCLDLDEIDATASRVRFFSHNRWNLYNFRDRDHLTLPGLEQGTVKENILTWIRAQPDPPNLPADPAQIRIHLITLPRVFGYIFNPVSFYFLADRTTAQPLCAVVQVGNTFREIKPYLIRHPEAPTSEIPISKSPPANQAPPENQATPPSQQPIQRSTFNVQCSTLTLQNSPAPTYRLIAPKHFYVSPFSALDLHFDFKLHLPGEHLQIHIDDRTGPDGPHVLLSSLTGPRRPLTTARLLWLTAKFPLITLKVIVLIHYQALRLWLRKLPFHKKSANPQLQKDVFNPH